MVPDGNTMLLIYLVALNDQQRCSTNLTLCWEGLSCWQCEAERQTVNCSWNGHLEKITSDTLSWSVLIDLNVMQVETSKKKEMCTIEADFTKSYPANFPFSVDCINKIITFASGSSFFFQWKWLNSPGFQTLLITIPFFFFLLYFDFLSTHPQVNLYYAKTNLYF